MRFFAIFSIAVTMMGLAAARPNERITEAREASPKYLFRRACDCDGVVACCINDCGGREQCCNTTCMDRFPGCEGAC
ncbi:uncharacterized protein J7T55_000889 [Diaporthe amygdali]|uniref:uncharacterized protein n=1 Tax=Phomopsis amygdali TaxID=1214568 RepID=UPI0022FECF68|nr:uncharacterized protein J7T55_000889 [Diaporthe amygdali]KAJ0120036.1 uncharacterized protein J7T55_000889 [Diaporthe amygdali]